MTDEKLARAVERLRAAARRITATHFTDLRHGFLSSEDAAVTELRAAEAAVGRALEPPAPADAPAAPETPATKDRTTAQQGGG